MAYGCENNIQGRYSKKRSQREDILGREFSFFLFKEI